MAREKLEATPIPTNFGKEDRQYRLKDQSAPLSYVLPTRNTNRFPLLWFDEKSRYNRSLRYARNQKTPFEDEQDDFAIVEPVMFMDGFLTVGKENPLLQWFLSMHPLMGRSFVELDRTQEAQQEIDLMELEIEALNETRKMNDESLRDMYQLIMAKSGRDVKISEAKATVMKYAKSFPEKFLHKLRDPNMTLLTEVHKFFSYGLITLRNAKDIFYNLKELRAKMTTIQKGDDPYFMVTQFLKTEEGMLKLRMLQDELEEAIALDGKIGKTI